MRGRGGRPCTGWMRGSIGDAGEGGGGTATDLLLRVNDPRPWYMPLMQLACSATMPPYTPQCLPRPGWSLANLVSITPVTPRRHTSCASSNAISRLLKMRGRSEYYVLAITVVGWSALCYAVIELSRKLRRTEDALLKEQQNKKSERSGRIRFEQELRRVQVEAATAGAAAARLHGGCMGDGVGAEVGTAVSASASSSDKTLSFPFKPIGTIKSCFSQR